MAKFVEKCKLLMMSLSIVLLVFSCVFFVGCKDKKHDNKNSVVSLTICEELKNASFFQNDYIDLSSYSVTVKLKKSKDLVLRLDDSNVYVSNFSTSEVGEFTATVSYQKKSVSFSYTVIEIVPVGIFYNGNDLTIYSQEGFDFSNIYLDVVYNNGAQSKVNLGLTSMSEIDRTCSYVKKTFTASYLGFTANINYYVTNRPFKELEIYEFVDNSGLFEDYLKYVCKSGDSFVYYRNLEGEVGFQSNLTIKEFNTYETFKIADRQKVYFTLTLVGNKVICEKK